MAELNLKTGEILQIDTYQPGVTEPPAPLEDLRDLIVQPKQSWFGPADREEVERSLWGRLAETSQDFYFLGRIASQHVGGVWYQVSRRTPEVGAFGYTFSDPAHRNKGISYLLCAAAVEHFRDRGGLCLYLGTSNPTAHRVYEKCGFRDYNGRVMRYVAPPNEHEALDSQLFGHCGPALIRLVEWGDAGMMNALYAAPYPWLIRDYGLRSFSHPAVLQTRCHIFPEIMLRIETENGACLALENPRHRIVGAAILTRGDPRVEQDVGTVDFIVQPGYMAQAPQLVSALIETADSRGCRKVQAHFASCDQDKKQVAKRAGFQCEAVLVEQLRAGDQVFDLEVWSRSLDA
ncbi:MAG: GNAT family N-acetyltransferase [Anaerolineae bacterium]